MCREDAERRRAWPHGGPSVTLDPPCGGGWVGVGRTSDQYRAPEAAWPARSGRATVAPPYAHNTWTSVGTARDTQAPRAQSPKAALGLGTTPAFLQCLASHGLFPTPLAWPVSVSTSFQPKAKYAFLRPYALPSLLSANPPALARTFSASPLSYRSGSARNIPKTKNSPHLCLHPGPAV